MLSVFEGEATDWSALGEPGQPIALYLRSDASGTFEVASSALGERSPAARAKRFDDNERLADAVSEDPGGIGFVAAASLRSARPVAILSASGAPLYPTPFTVATESYPLSRRLYLYTPEHSGNPLVMDFVRYALSVEGQKTVRSAGFVDLNPSAADADPCPVRCPARYASMLRNARRVSLDFRFRPGTLELDSRAPDVDRLVAFLRDQGGSIALIGFSDSGPGKAASLKDSMASAKAVDEELRERGVRAVVVDGFGDAMPIATPLDELHRSRNRHVEVWLVAGTHSPRPASHQGQ
jgi:phosphate transport system substrate-binding protein